MGQYVCLERLIDQQLELENFIELHHTLKSKIKIIKYLINKVLELVFDTIAESSFMHV